MKGAVQHALTDAELDRLAERLAAEPKADALSLVGVDGPFCALIAGPDTVLPGAYLPVILGGERGSSRVFKDLEDANDKLSVLMRYWNSIAQDFARESVPRRPPKIPHLWPPQIPPGESGLTERMGATEA
jgi:yecA family protein